MLSSASLLDFQDLIDYNNAVFAFKYKKASFQKHLKMSLLTQMTPLGRKQTLGQEKVMEILT